MKFTIDRATWRCGGNGNRAHGAGETKLLNKEGFMCCLGQISEQLGVPRESLNHAVPSNVCKAHIEKLSPVLVRATEPTDYLPGDWHNTDLAGNAMELNDHEESYTEDGDEGVIDREQREQSLTQHFLDHGHELVFTGEYTDNKPSPVSE